MRHHACARLAGTDFKLFASQAELVAGTDGGTCNYADGASENFVSSFRDCTLVDGTGTHGWHAIYGLADVSDCFNNKALCAATQEYTATATVWVR